MKNQFVLSQDGKEVYRSDNEFDCLLKLQRSQGQSANWAMKYGGWKLEEINPVFLKDWTPDDFDKARMSITKHFKGRTFDSHKGKVTFGNSYKSIDDTLGLAYTSSSSLAMLGVCNIHIKADADFTYNHFGISENGNVFAELWDKDENVKLIQLT